MGFSPYNGGDGCNDFRDGRNCVLGAEGAMDCSNFLDPWIDHYVRKYGDLFLGGGSLDKRHCHPMSRMR